MWRFLLLCVCTLVLAKEQLFSEISQEERRSFQRFVRDNACDACQIIVWNLETTLKKIKGLPSMRDKPLKESDYFESMENACGNSTMPFLGNPKQGGLTAVKVNIGADAGRFSSRSGSVPLKEFCLEMITDVGEDVLYLMRWNSKDIASFFQAFCFESSQVCSESESATRKLQLARNYHSQDEL